MGRFADHRSRLALGPPALALLALVILCSGVNAAYNATVDVNDTAFDPQCRGGFENSFPEKMFAAAAAAYRDLGYTTQAVTGPGFTKAHVLARTPSDWGYYVHSHGDMYAHGDGKRYSGFRTDDGRCTGASIVYSKDIAAKRSGRASNLVVMSTCYLGDSNTTMPGAFAIQKDKAGALEWNGPEFYLGYLGAAWDSDEWKFEQRFWDALADRKGVGAAFDLALSAGGFQHPFDADWWGSYYWTGIAGPTSTCPHCS